MHLTPDSELSLIASLRAHAPRIGDDCAVIPSGSHDLLVTTDLLVEGVHFRRSWSPQAIGAKAVVRSISDIAAMGGTPKYCLLSVAFPSTWPIARFYRGVLDELKRYRTELIGGDVSRTDRFTCDVTAIGRVPHGKALLRSTAQPGDAIYVSGPLGASASRDYRVPPIPRARIRFGRKLRGIATACMDLSDGLSIDLHRLCLESQVSAAIDHLPIATGATEHHALHGGEDYELLFTAAAPVAGAIRIGRIRAGSPGQVFYRSMTLRPLGHDHFARELK